MPPRDDSARPSLFQALMDEGIRAERSGQREIARRRYESVLYLLGPGDASQAAAILRRVARSYIDDAQVDVALDCLPAALAIAELQDDPSAIAHALNLMATAYLQRSDLASAEREYVRAFEVASAANDELLKAMVAQNLGIILTTRGNMSGALSYYRASLETYRALGVQEHLGGLLNNMAMAYTNLQRFDEALATYLEAKAQCEQVGDVQTRLMVEVNITSHWLNRGNVDEADAISAQVITEARTLGDQRAINESLMQRGVVARVRGQLEDAEQLLAEAFARAMDREDLLLAAETAREQAELFEVLDRSRDTLQALSLSHRLFTELRASRDLADLAQRVGRLESRFYEVVKRWAETIEAKDPYTMGHCERVSTYACSLARHVGIDEITMFWFRVGALLHDVGKIAVPVEVLNKAGPLTPAERHLMERHAEAGADLLRDMDFPWDVLPMVRGHHERWDGTGYPDRLAGSDIPQAARILCVADVFDALTTDRPYRAAYTRDEALEIMRADAGRIFEPALFEQFAQLMRGQDAIATLESFPRSPRLVMVESEEVAALTALALAGAPLDGEVRKRLVG